MPGSTLISSDNNDDDDVCDNFAELDREIDEYERKVFTRLNPSSPSSGSSNPSLLQRLFQVIRSKLSERNTEKSQTVQVAKDPNQNCVLCRICESTIDLNVVEGHTEWCSRYQDCLIKKEQCSKYLEILDTKITQDCPILTRLSLKALSIDEELGRPASVKLAKLLYRLTKLYSEHALTQDPVAILIKRLKYLIEQKRILADQFAELKPMAIISGSPGDAISSTTNSSLEGTPKRPSTPVARLATLISSLVVRKTREISKSPSNLNTSPGARTRLRNTVPRISDFEVIKPISRGGCGNIYLAKKKKTDDLYAIKTLRKSELIKKNMASHVLTERRLMSLAQAPFIVKLYYAFESSEFLFLVMEYLIGGDLSSKIQSDGPLTEPIARFYISELVEAIEYLHENGIIHRDIKPDNILLDAQGHLKLTDFGLAGLQWQQQSGLLLGTPEYIAPEVIRGEDYGTAVDWWSAGITLFELLVGVPPFTGNTPEQIFQSITEHRCINWPAYEGEGISPVAKDLIDRLLDPNPNTRLGSFGTKLHPFFSGVEWTLIRSREAPLKPLITDPLDTSSFAARNLRYSDIDLPSSFKEAEPIITMSNVNNANNNNNSSTDEITCGSGFSTPGRFANSSTMRASHSPFDGFSFKNVQLLGQENRKYSSTQSITKLAGHNNISRTSSGALSDGGF